MAAACAASSRQILRRRCPRYLGLLVPQSHYLLVVRALRLLRVFRILKLTEFLREAQQLQAALRASRRKIAVFLLTVVTIVLIVGSLMYVVDRRRARLRRHPHVDLLGDRDAHDGRLWGSRPPTPLGKALASVVMLLGYGILPCRRGSSPSSSEGARAPISTQACRDCGHAGHDSDAVHCKLCGAKI